MNANRCCKVSRSEEQIWAGFRFQEPVGNRGGCDPDVMYLRGVSHSCNITCSSMSVQRVTDTRRGCRATNNRKAHAEDSSNSEEIFERDYESVDCNYAISLPSRKQSWLLQIYFYIGRSLKAVGKSLAQRTCKSANCFILLIVLTKLRESLLACAYVLRKRRGLGSCNKFFPWVGHFLNGD